MCVPHIDVKLHVREAVYICQKCRVFVNIREESGPDCICKDNPDWEVRWFDAGYLRVWHERKR